MASNAQTTNPPRYVAPDSHIDPSLQREGDLTANVSSPETPDVSLMGDVPSLGGTRSARVNDDAGSYFSFTVSPIAEGAPVAQLMHDEEHQNGDLLDSGSQASPQRTPLQLNLEPTPSTPLSSLGTLNAPSLRKNRTRPTKSNPVFGMVDGCRRGHSSYGTYLRSALSPRTKFPVIQLLRGPNPSLFHWHNGDWLRRHSMLGWNR
jgi:hypothetical protein